MDLLRHLKLFEAVAEAEHFGRAAEMVGMAQPPMSQAIKRLERELGTTLFERTPHGARLTPAGRRVRGEAQQVRTDVERLRAAASTQASAHVDLRVDPGVPESWTSELGVAARGRGPQLRLIPSSTWSAVDRVREHGGTALVMAPVRTEGLRVGTPLRCPLVETIPGHTPSVPVTAFVHPSPPGAALHTLRDGLRARGVIGELVPMSRLAASGELLAGRVSRVITIGHPSWPEAIREDTRTRPYHPMEASVTFQLVTRRDERDRTVLATWDLLQRALSDIPVRDDV